MDWAWLIFALLLAMCAVMGAALLTEEAPKEVRDGETVYLGHGTQHPEYGAMLVGGPGEARHERILWIGWAFGFLQCLFFVACLIFGSIKKGSEGPMRTPLLIGGAIYAAIFTGMVVSYDRFVSMGADIPLFLSFPRPTAWMMYGVWGFPLLFLAYYLWKFNSWVYRPEDEVEFQRILSEGRERAAKETA